MSKLNSFIANANGALSSCHLLITAALQEAEAYAFPKLNITWDIDVVITSRIYEFLIPEDGVGGRAYASDFIVISIDERKITENTLSETIVHELCHAARWGKNKEWATTLLYGAISEGLATHFEAEFVKNKEEQQFFLKTITNRAEKENQKILNLLKNHLQDTNYDYPTIFFSGNDKLPRWSGYSLGYYAVKNYLKKTSKTIDRAFTDAYSEIASALHTTK